MTIHMKGKTKIENVAEIRPQFYRDSFRGRGHVLFCIDKEGNTLRGVGEAGEPYIDIENVDRISPD